MQTTHKFYFKGPAVNLGRFGDVKEGDVLTLTPHEAVHIAEDKRFEAYDEKKHAKKKEVKTIELPKGFDKMKADEKAKVLKDLGLPENFEKLNDDARAEAIAAASKLQNNESDRKDIVEQRNRESEIEVIRQMKVEELRELVKKLRDEGKTVDCPEGAKANVLRKAIMNTLFGENSAPDAIGDDKE
jgi:DNA mismatch repair ATPase MutL